MRVAQRLIFAQALMGSEEDICKVLIGKHSCRCHGIKGGVCLHTKHNSGLFSA